MNLSSIQPVADQYLDALDFDDIEGFADGVTMQFGELKPGKLAAVESNMLGAVFRFQEAPKTAEHLWQMVRDRYKLPENLEAEFVALVRDLIDRHGLELEAEYQFLLGSLAEIVTDGTVTLTEDAAARLSAAEEAEKPAQTDLPSWGKVGLIAALGVGFTTAMQGFKKKSKERKMQEKEQQVAA